MEKIIRKIAKTMDKVANRVGNLEKKVKEKFDKKAPENLKNFIKEPRIIFENADRLISKSQIIDFLNTQKEGIHFSKMLELIVRLKINNLFEPKKTSNKETINIDKRKSSSKKRTTNKKL